MDLLQHPVSPLKEQHLEKDFLIEIGICRFTNHRQGGRWCNIYKAPVVNFTFYLCVRSEAAPVMGRQNRDSVTFWTNIQFTQLSLIGDKIWLKVHNKKTTT